MTGTAISEKKEFQTTYGLSVVKIPTYKRNIRIDHKDKVYIKKEDKLNAIVEDVKEKYAIGRPILIGTLTVEESEHISNLLKKADIPHTLLNAKTHDEEASIIARAGKLSNITVATNIAGRGTDIILGGCPDADDYSCSEKEEVISLGGLYIIGTQRSTSMRVDRQLAGRSGRQGDPGETQFYISAEDDIITQYSNQKAVKLLNKTSFFAKRSVKRLVHSSQKLCQLYYYQQRKNTNQFDDIDDLERENVYALRNRIIDDGESDKRISNLLRAYSKKVTIAAMSSDDKLKELHRFIGCEDIKFDFSFSKKRKKTLLLLEDVIYNHLKDMYSDKLEVTNRDIHFDKELFEKGLLLSSLDMVWTEYLSMMSNYIGTINAYHYGTVKPRELYKREVVDLHNDLYDSMTDILVSKICDMTVVNRKLNLSILKNITLVCE